MHSNVFCCCIKEVFERHPGVSDTQVLGLVRNNVSSKIQLGGIQRVTEEVPARKLLLVIWMQILIYLSKK